MAACPLAVHVRRCCAPQPGRPQFGILVGFKTYREIDETVAGLLARSTDVHGYYVLLEEDESSGDERRGPTSRRRAEGRVEAVGDGRLILSDAPQLTEVPADRA